MVFVPEAERRREADERGEEGGWRGLLGPRWLISSCGVRHGSLVFIVDDNSASELYET